MVKNLANFKNFIFLVSLVSMLLGSILIASGLQDFETVSAQPEYSEVQANNSVNQTTVKPTVVSSCGSDNWVRLSSTGKMIPLGYESIDSWEFESEPSILTEAQNNRNTILLGHNYCENGDCYKPTTDFGTALITAEKGDVGSACINGNFFQGKIIVSQELDETATYILDDWLNRPIITMFTCYGECHDPRCLAVKSRWVVAFEKY